MWHVVWCCAMLCDVTWYVVLYVVQCYEMLCGMLCGVMRPPKWPTFGRAELGCAIERLFYFHLCSLTKTKFGWADFSQNVFTLLWSSGALHCHVSEICFNKFSIQLICDFFLYFI
jgi:hypothetical protein